MVKLRVLELFAGIGGMHRACQLVQGVEDVEFEVVAAVDVNTTANTIYRHNHPDTPHWQRDIKGLSSAELNKLRPDVLLMSPPCQPHTRQGKRMDNQDPRSDGLKHLLQLIPSIQTLKYILLENVQGFEVSEARRDFIDILQSSGFHLQEFLISPAQIDVPNSRLRYYAVAKKNSLPWRVEVPGLQLDFSILKCSVSKLDRFIKTGSIGQFIQPGEHTDLLLEDKALAKYGKVLDIVNSCSQRSCCFTKAYAHYYEGTGSVLQQSGDLDAAFANREMAGTDGEATAGALRGLKLRFFAPREIACLMGFPESFYFPEDMSLKQKYRTLGNSLNVNVVAILIDHLIF